MNYWIEKIVFSWIRTHNLADQYLLWLDLLLYWLLEYIGFEPKYYNTKKWIIELKRLPPVGFEPITWTDKYFLWIDLLLYWLLGFKLDLNQNTTIENLKKKWIMQLERLPPVGFEPMTWSDQKLWWLEFLLYWCLG